jgi:hypothetical protein
MRFADFGDHDAEPKAAFWAAGESSILLVHARVAPTSSHYKRAGANAVAVVFVTPSALVLHAMQCLDGTAVPIASDLPAVSVVHAAAAGPVLRSAALECFEVRPTHSTAALSSCPTA